MQGQGRRFIDVGCGNGHLSKIMLERGFVGEGIDLNTAVCEENRRLNAQYLGASGYRVVNTDFMKENSLEPADIVMSSMVMEHFSDEALDAFILRCVSLLKPGGHFISFVPGSNRHWGIEDEIAGHYRRYEFECCEKLAKKHGLSIEHIAGLTFPLSNVLYPLSNYLVQRAESHKRSLSMQQRTIQSGNRNVRFKTTFPLYVRLLLNEFVLYPWHVVQKLFRHNPNSLVIYCEMSVRRPQ